MQLLLRVVVPDCAQTRQGLCSPSLSASAPCCTNKSNLEHPLSPRRGSHTACREHVRSLTIQTRFHLARCPSSFLSYSSKQSHGWLAAIVEARILEVGRIFACDIYGYAVMSNHLHIVVHMDPNTARDWTPLAVATRRIRLYISPKS
jgi:hypothetical protein